MAPGVHGDHPLVLGKGLQLAVEVAPVLPVPVEEDQRRALALLGIVQVNVHKNAPVCKKNAPSACRHKRRYGIAVPLSFLT